MTLKKLIAPTVFVLIVVVSIGLIILYNKDHTIQPIENTSVEFVEIVQSKGRGVPTVFRLTDKDTGIICYISSAGYASTISCVNRIK